MTRQGQIVLGAIFGAIAAGAVSTLAAAAVATFLLCGAWPTRVGFLDGFWLLAGKEVTVATIEGCSPTREWALGSLIGIALLLAALTVLATVGWMRWRESDTYFVRDLRFRRGFALRREVDAKLSARVVRKKAKTLRPGLGKAAQAEDVAWKVGSSRGVEAYVSIEDSVIVIGPPRSGKGFRFIINAILDWPGPLITTSTRNDNLAATMAMREKLGTVTVFDPQRLSGVRSAMKISPVTGCGDPMVSEQRAAALVAGSGLGTSGQNAEWAGAAREVLSQLLLAAAVDRRDVRALARWGSNPAQAAEAVEILERSGPPGWSTSLDAVLTGDVKLLANKWFGVSAALAPLRIPQIAEAMTPGPGDQVFDPVEFLQGQNTLYLIGTKSGAGAAGGYLAALLDDIVEQARRRALSMPGSRLSPPLGLVLDEIANIFAWPALPTVMADGGGVGISPLVVLQARSQAETAWSRAEMDSVFSSATAKLLLGGSTDTAFLRDMETLLGHRDADRRSRSYSDQGTSHSVQSERLALLTTEEMRRMPPSLGLLTYRNIRPVLLDLDAWIDRDDAKEIQAAKRSTETSQRQVFAEQDALARATRQRYDRTDAPAGGQG